MIRIGALTLSIALGAMALTIHAASADDKLAGVWKLQSWVMENVETKETKAVFGEQPNGYLIFTREGRMIGLLTAQGRKAPQTEAEREAAYRSMLAYSGRYRMEGESPKSTSLGTKPGSELSRLVSTRSTARNYRSSAPRSPIRISAARRCGEFSPLSAKENSKELA
jgi:hypothetical protein